MNKTTMAKRIITCTMLLALLLQVLTGCTNKGTVRLGTGGTGGTYYAYGEELSKLDSSIEVKTTAGSEANMRLLDKGFIDAAIVQSDSLDVSDGNLAALTGLYTEAVQLVASKNSHITSVTDLRGKKVSIGETESGVVRNAQQIFLVAGMTVNDVDVKNLSFSDSVKALEKGEIDAFFCTAGAPTEAVSSIINSGDAVLIGFDEDMIKRLLNLYPGYNECIIPAGTYKGQDSEVHTVGVRAVLVVNPQMKYDTANNLIDLIFANSKELNKNIATDDELTADLAVMSVGIPFHEAAADYLQKKGVKVAKWTGSSNKAVFGSQDN